MIVATDGLLDDQDTLLLVALFGDTMADNLEVSPTVSDNDIGDRVTPSTETVTTLTVTSHAAVFDPSEVLTVIVALPVVFAVTTPLDETVATNVLLDDQDTPELVALDGVTVAVS